MKIVQLKAANEDSAVNKTALFHFSQFIIQTIFLFHFQGEPRLHEPLYCQ